LEEAAGYARLWEDTYEFITRDTTDNEFKKSSQPGGFFETVAG
jgi:hypothetical protein